MTSPFPNKPLFLADTYDTLTSGTKNAVEVCKKLGIELGGIRIDSGDLAYLSKEAKKIMKKEFPDAKVCLSNAQSNISDAYLSYNNNFQGNSATVKLSTFTNSNSKIRKIREKLAKIYEEATAKLKKLNQKISSNNASIGVLTYNIADCNKAINKFKQTKSDNSKKITYYNTKRRKEQDNIARLRKKLNS